MRKTTLVRERGDTRPVAYTCHGDSYHYVDRAERSKTRVVGPTGIRGHLDFGPTTPGPFGEVVGLIEESKVVFRYRPWGSVEPGRHALDVRYEGAEYILVSRGRRPTPHLESIDGTTLAVFGNRKGRLARIATPHEGILAALIAASGIANITLPQSWAARH
ncbi:MAG: hypothetical protein KJP22_05475 [Acidimicrobiia bacterium]|nr:hypothetical protein [Acidimicrobiia bacterium]MBT8192834.1 hypothetical protein [Acidimicrobiia bacterium]NNF87463.1 hypothetical protein [Acidimicrobiia bacterium]NNJ48118.1 hypothetical protein [Acidimicrobiia bacterium]NNL12651.1 hypothetical protein [Acidimicrobiia bacterium]